MRTRVNQRLERAAAFPVVLLVAPAGFGKSLALHDYLLSTRSNAVRCDLRREDETLLAFARRLCAGIDKIARGTSASFGAVHGAGAESLDAPERLCDWLSSHLERVSCTIAIDDFHYAAADPRAVTLLRELVERTHERIRWIVASRSDAGLPVATWMAYGRMDAPLGEDDLRFTFDEALAAADDGMACIDSDEIAAICDLTRGWPVALTIALRTRTHVTDLRAASSGTREMVYRYLAEQIFNGLGEAHRRFLLASCVYSAFDAEIGRELGADTAFLAEIRQKTAFVSEIAPGVYRYHDLFREFLENELLRLGDTQATHALQAAADVLERRADEAGALALYARAGDVASVLRILERSGFALLERGRGDVLRAALAAVPEGERNANAAALGLGAALDAARGHFDLTQRRFVDAIDRARDDALRLHLVHRYAIELVRHDRACAELLEHHAGDDCVRPELRVPLLGTLATEYARNGDTARAVRTIEDALELLDPQTSDDVRARLFQQAAYVYRLVPDFTLARRHATLAVELSLERNLYDVAARAYSALYAIAYDENDDPIASLSILDKLLECARKGGSTQALLFGLLATYAIESERGNENELERIDRKLQSLGGGLTHVREQVLLPARALQLGWQGDFKRAYELLAGTAATQNSDERRAYRASEIALYAFAAGLTAEGDDALDAAANWLGRCPASSRRTLRARLNVVFTELVRGHHATAYRALCEVERALEPEMRCLRACASAARAVYRIALGQAERPLLAGALERLRAEQFGGIARLLTALPFRSELEPAYAALTVAEREVLQLLATGASTKEIAVKTLRSPRTVDTHVRAICQKLRCSGRREAVAHAIGSGWVER